MFLFRYAFLLSFFLLMLAGYGWEQLTKDDYGLFLGLILTLIIAFSIAYGLIPKDQYTYLNVQSFY